jgi:hypothetical protein
VRLRFCVFGVEVLSFESVPDSSDADSGGANNSFGAGETHNFERDTSPLSPDDRWDWPYEDRRGGFGFKI